MLTQRAVQVHGNSTITSMTYNAVRLLCSFGSPDQSTNIPVVSGTSVPLVRHLASSSSIHGADGLGGVEGLLDRSDAKVSAKLAEAMEGNAVVTMADACRSLAEGEQLVLVATGAFTNVALFLSVFPELAKEKVREVVVMGGAEGRGNKSPVAEVSGFLFLLRRCFAHGADLGCVFFEAL